LIAEFGEDNVADEHPSGLGTKIDVVALGDHDRGSTGFENREDVVKNHVIASRVAGQQGVEPLNRYGCIGLLPLRAECGLLGHHPV